jgi:pimeloyl-ACP methyl ester carboxylesterase
VTATSLLPVGGGQVEYAVRGSGDPVTVFAHGLAGSIAETRPLASGVPGTRAFLHFRGHGGSTPPAGDRPGSANGAGAPWSYTALADELRAVADATGARQALGVSMGAGALCRVLAQTPDRFDRLVFFLPAVLDEPRRDEALDRLVAMADLVDAGDVDGVAAVLRSEQPDGVRDRADVQTWVRRQAETLVRTPVARALRDLPYAVALDDRAALARVTAPALVVAQRGDDAHPVHVAEALADVLPRATLHVFEERGAVWLARERLRALVSGFLAG